MYLLGSQEAADLVSRDPARPIMQWLKATVPGRNDLFVSVITLGMIANMIEEMAQPEREQWRRAFALARRTWIDQGSIIDVDLAISEVWSSQLLPMDLEAVDPGSGERDPLGEDEKLVIATAIARGYSLVTARTEALDHVADNTILTIVEP